MPWEICIQDKSCDDKVPLGRRDEVSSALIAALPGVALQKRPPIPAELLQQMPEELRKGLNARSTIEALYETGEYSIEFFADDQPILYFLHMQVRGNGDPLPVLAAICRGRNWCVFDVAGKSVVDLESARRKPPWNFFRAYRDKAIDKLRDLQG